MEPHRDIAVVIPCYNHASVLRRTLKALAHQTLKPAEVIVVDDGSSDDPTAIVAQFESTLPIKSLTLRHNHGAPFARNEGARLTSAPFLLFLDADAELVHDALETMHKTLIAHPEAAFVYSNFKWGAKLFRGKPFSPDELKRQNYIHTSSLLRREQFPGFDESIKKFQDWDLWLTVTNAGGVGEWIPRTLFRIEPRKTGYSHWLPRIAYRIPWKKLGFEPKEITNYRAAESIVKHKHGL